MEQATRITEQRLKDLDLIIADDVAAVIEKIKSKETKNKIGFTA